MENSIWWCATVRALKSFEGFTEGQIYELLVTVRVAHLIANQYLEVIDKWLLHSE